MDHIILSGKGRFFIDGDEFEAEAGDVVQKPNRPGTNCARKKWEAIMREVIRPMERFLAMDSPYFLNSEGFARAFIQNDPKYVSLVLFDHAMNDWRDVIRHKINVPTAIFTGDYSPNIVSQRWMKSVILNSTLYVYSKSEQGDHFLAFKNPVKFTKDLNTFLEQ